MVAYVLKIYQTIFNGEFCKLGQTVGRQWIYGKSLPDVNKLREIPLAECRSVARFGLIENDFLVN